ncbi:MAG: T9SS type A sorting domain-containing protein [Saprospiraceae bacterium]|nr:T9SS type A sorting domain-containing protein [Saprospiraceae bacterium]
MKRQLPHYLLITCLSFLLLHPAWGQGWERTYEQTGKANIVSVVQTADGGYVATGSVESPTNNTDIFLMKTDAEGNKLWLHNYGGAGQDSAWVILLADDGGYIVVGTTTSFGQGGQDVYVLKTNPRGDIIWERTYGGSQNDGDGLLAAITTSDGGFAIGTVTRSSDGDVVGHNGSSDIWLLRLDSEGGITGSWCYGGTEADYMGRRGLLQTPDGGFILSGGIACGFLLYTPICDAVHIIKTDADGAVEWSNSYTGGYDFATVYGGMLATADDGFVVACWVDTLLNGIPEHNEIGLLKINASGDLQWFKNYEISPGAVVSLPLDIIETKNNELVVSCLVFPTPDGWLLKTDGGGEFLAQKNVGGAFETYLWSVSQTADDGFIVGGFTKRGAAEIAYLVKTDSLFNSFTNSLSGILFRDEGNCLYDGAEPPLKQWLIKVEKANQAYYTVTDTMGRFSTLVDTGTYVLSVQSPNALWIPCGTVQVNFGQFFQTVDTAIGVLTPILCPVMVVDIGTPLLRRCFDNFYNISYCNEGTAVADSAHVYLAFDTFLDVDTSTLPGQWEHIGGNIFLVELGDVPPQHCGSFSVKVTVNCDSTIIGERKCARAHILPDSPCLPSLNWDESDIVVTATCTGDTVLFTIKNTGTGDMQVPAEFIIIEETVLYFRGEFRLNAGADTIFLVENANNQTWRLEALQHPEHPYSEIASATIEGCPENTNFSFLLQYPQDESRPHTAVDCHPIVGSWDPNDKQTFPEGLGDEHTIRDNTPLKYLIRFQNTGTDTAFRVVIRDTLSPFLDMASVRPGASSHPYLFEIVQGNVLKFIFDDIMLPDSNTNEVASHGFVQFSVRQTTTPSNPPGTRIENSAAIYFDYNAPELTNIVFHTVAEPSTITFSDTICNPGEPNKLSADTSQFSYFEVIHEIFKSGTLHHTLDTLVCMGVTIFGFVVDSSTLYIEHTLLSVNGCDSILAIHVYILPAAECIVSIQTPAFVPHFQLYPNPTTGDLTLRLAPEVREQILSIEIRDAMGQLRQVWEPPFVGNNTALIALPVSGLSTGVHFLTVRSQNGAWTGIFVKLN